MSINITSYKAIFLNLMAVTIIGGHQRKKALLQAGYKPSDVIEVLDTGLIFQDKFLLILLPFLSVAFKRHFVNNHDKHSLVFDNQCSNEIFDYYIYPCSY